MATEISIKSAGADRRQKLVLLVLAASASGLAVSISPVVALAVAAGAATFLLFSVRVDYFVLFLVVYTPFEEFVLKWLPDAVYAPARYAGEALMAMIFIVVLLKNFLVSGKVWRSSPIDPPVALLFAVIFFSAVSNDVPAHVAALGVKNLLRYLFLFYIVVNSDFSEEFWKRLVFVLLALGAAEASLGVVQYALKGDFLKLFAPADVKVGELTLSQAELLQGKALGTLGRYNFLGNFLNVVMCIGMGLYYSGDKVRKSGYALFFAVTLAGLVASFSRMSWLGLYLAFVFILLIQKKKRAIIYTIGPVILTMALIVASQGAYWYKGETGKASVVERYVSIFSSGYIEKAMRFDRLFAIFVTAPAVVDQYPVFGLGPGTFANEVTGGGTSLRGIYPEYSHEYWLGIRKAEALQYTSDQGWTAILCQLGLSGLFCFAWILWSLFRWSLRVYRRSGPGFRRGMALGFLAFLMLLVFQNFVSFNLTYRPVSLYFWLIAGYMVVLAGKTARHEEKISGI